MTAATDRIIDQLASDATPVRPLGSPAWRAWLTMTLLALALGAAILLLGDAGGLQRRYGGRETLLMVEMVAMLATACVAILAAFFVSVPGRSRAWLAAPLPFLLLWLALSAAGGLARSAPSAVVGGGESSHCLLFILGASAALAPWLIIRLAPARPIEPLPVALLSGLGIAAASAFTLQFFHAAPVTMIDLCVHAVAVGLVVAIAGLLNRPLLARP